MIPIKRESSYFHIVVERVYVGMKRYQWIAIILGGIIVAIVAAYVIFAVLLIGFDVASYSSDGVTVSDLEFEDALERAETAGYTVERVASSGFHPEGVDELDTELGPDYEVVRVTFDHSDTRRMWATFNADEGLTIVTFFADNARGPFTVEHLPPDEWLVDRFRLLFEMDETTASTYVEELEEQIRTGDPSEPGASTPSIEVNEPVDFHATYGDLTDRASSVNVSSSPGSGWHERGYYAEEHKLGGIEFVLSRATITHEARGYTYRVHIDYHGGVSVDAQTRSYRDFEEDEVRTVFREIFEEMGIPPDTIDHLQLEYRGSVW
jgi:hypothetical protein